MATGSLWLQDEPHCDGHFMIRQFSAKNVSVGRE